MNARCRSGARGLPAAVHCPLCPDQLNQSREIAMATMVSGVTSVSSRGVPYPLGASVVPGGVNFSVYSRTAEGLDLLLFDRANAPAPTQVIRLDPDLNKTYHYWHVFVA